MAPYIDCDSRKKTCGDYSKLVHPIRRRGTVDQLHLETGGAADESAARGR